MRLRALHAQQINAGKLIDAITEPDKAIPNTTNMPPGAMEFLPTRLNENIAKLKPEQNKATAEI